jgi:pimeloyl-ACP methyl ester carboxylesterase
MSALIIHNDIVHYEVLGRGRPIIFLHGWVGSWRYWIPSMQAASTAYRSYALDMWGFGDTSKAASRYSIDDQVNLLDSFLEEMGIGRIALVGHDLGAIVAMRYAQKFPRFVDRVMAIGFPLATELINERLRSAAPAELGNWLLDGLTGVEAALQETAKADSQAIASTLKNVDDLNLHDLVLSLGIPCLLVHGENDPAVTIPPIDTLANLNDHAHHIIFENTGHYPMLSEPNKFNRLLADFLALQQGESPRNLQLKEEWKRRFR